MGRRLSSSSTAGSRTNQYRRNTRRAITRIRTSHPASSAWRRCLRRGPRCLTGTTPRAPCRSLKTTESACSPQALRQQFTRTTRQASTASPSPRSSNNSNRAIPRASRPPSTRPAATSSARTTGTITTTANTMSYSRKGKPGQRD